MNMPQEKKTRITGRDNANMYPNTFSMDSLSPLPQYCAANMEPPAVMDMVKRVSTSTTCVASDTAAIES